MENNESEIPEPEGKIPVALTIAGSDSGGGAGIQADLKTFAALGAYGASAITALTAQNTCGVEAVFDVPADFVAAQIDAVANDMKVDAVKTGMLSKPEIVEVVAQCIKAHAFETVVVDPVMISKSGHALLSDEARQVLIEKLLPLALVVTPNLHEAGVLADMPVESMEDMRKAARKIYDMGPKCVLVKGGHLEGVASDLLYDGRVFMSLPGKRLLTRHTHGTGCTFASAVAAGLARGLDVYESVRQAKDYISQAIAEGLAVGRGQGPPHHMAILYRAANISFVRKISS
jgi:hydroxymethylpyrimidine/phosphomethylpyrimidine kinase